MREEEGERSPEQAEEENLSPKESLEVVSVVSPHVHSCRQMAAGR